MLNCQEQADYEMEGNRTIPVAVGERYVLHFCVCCVYAYHQTAPDPERRRKKPFEGIVTRNRAAER